MNFTKIFLIGVGGQGSLLASRILSEAIMRDGLKVVMSEVNGMSQRGGVVESAVVIGGAKSPLIRKGDADIVVAFEPNEAIRAIQYVSAKTSVIINTRQVIPSSVSIGNAVYIDTKDVIKQLTPLAKEVRAFEATKIAEDAGTSKASNIVVLGALLGLNLIPCKVETLRDVVAEFVPYKFRQLNMQALKWGMEFDWEKITSNK